MINRITLRQMQYFVSTARYQGIARASAQIHISSASISAAISHIEAELQQQLFIRQHAKGLVLSACGEKIYQEFVFILARVDGLYRRAEKEAASITQRLIVGCDLGAVPDIFVRIFQRFQYLYPQLELELIDLAHGDLMQGLLSQHFDLLITTQQGIDQDIFNFEKLSDFSPSVLLSLQHPLAMQDAVSLVQLLDYPLLLQQSPSVEHYITQLFVAQGLNPNIAQRYHSKDLLFTMLSNHSAYSILYFDGIDYGQHHELKKIQLLGHVPTLGLGIAQIKQRVLPQQCDDFIQFCHAALQDPNTFNLNLSAAYIAMDFNKVLQS